MFSRRPPMLLGPSGVLASARLGDLLTLPDGRSYSVRMLANLPENALELDGLCLLGDLEVLLAPKGSGMVEMLSPFQAPPPGAQSARPLLDGAASFWAPHLPAIGGAMGEVTFRLLQLRASFAPMVVIDRGGDLVFFLRIGEIPTRDLSMLRLPVSDHDQVPVTRFAAVVEPLPIPAPVPSPSSVPMRAPSRLG